MKDWDTGDFNLIHGYGENLKVKLKSLSLHDVRCGPPYLSVKECNEINQKCNEFFKSRGMPVGRVYLRTLNNL